MIRFVRIREPRTPLVTWLVGYERLDDGTFAYATEAVARSLIETVVERYGRDGLRTMWSNLKRDVATRCASREQILEHEYDEIKRSCAYRTAEAWEAVTGLSLYDRPQAVAE